MKIRDIKTITQRPVINFLLFWQKGSYAGTAYQPLSKLVNRYFCWIDRHTFGIPFSVKHTEDQKHYSLTLKCRHCGHEEYFTREIEELKS